MSTQTAAERIAADILEIANDIREMEDGGQVSTPGGIEHLGDVWRLIFRWEREIKAEQPAE